MTWRAFVGQDVANPAAMILSSTMLLRHLGCDREANKIAHAVYEVIEERKVRCSARFPVQTRSGSH